MNNLIKKTRLYSIRKSESMKVKKFPHYYSFVTNKKHTQKAVDDAFFLGFSKKTTLNTEIINFYPSIKLNTNKKNISSNEVEYGILTGRK